MLKKYLSVLVFAACSTAATAADSPFYVGVQLSATELKESEAGNSDSFDFTTLSALAGYQFTPYIAAEVRLGTGVKDESYRELDYSEKLSVDLQSMLLLKGIVPVTDTFSLYGLAGYASTKFKYQERETGFSYSETETINGVAWGVGAGFRITPRLTATLEYLQLPDEKFYDGPYNFKLKTNNLTLGVNYQF
jgi:opacity protein-like surface antigen